jgi:hypothetical protein
MTTLHPDCHRPTRHRSDKAVTSDTFTVRLPRWRFARLFGRNPLVHPADRVEALVVVLALVMALVAVPPWALRSTTPAAASTPSKPRTVTWSLP